MKKIELEHKKNLEFIEKNNIEIGTIVRDVRLNEKEIGGIHRQYGWLLDKNSNQIPIESIYEIINKPKRVNNKVSMSIKRFEELIKKHDSVVAILYFEFLIRVDTVDRIIFSVENNIVNIFYTEV